MREARAATAAARRAAAASTAAYATKVAGALGSATAGKGSGGAKGKMLSFGSDGPGAESPAVAAKSPDEELYDLEVVEDEEEEE